MLQSFKKRFRNVDILFVIYNLPELAEIIGILNKSTELQPGSKTIIQQPIRVELVQF